MQRKWLVAAVTAASVAALASPAAAWGTRSNAQAYGSYGWGGPGFGFGVTVGGPYAANWGWGWNGYNNAYAASPGGCTCGTAAYGWGYPSYGWSGYAYQPGWNYGYASEPGVSVGFGDYGVYGGRREFGERYGTRVYHRNATRSFREGRTIHTGRNIRSTNVRSASVRGGTVGMGARGSSNFEGSGVNAGANANIGGNGGANLNAGGGRNAGGAGPGGRRNNQ